MSVTSTDVFDYDVLGRVDSSGQLTVYTGKQAISNSIVMWITSFRNDVLRSPGIGGYVTQHLYKPMSVSTKRNLLDAITDGINQDYRPTVTLKSLSVTPDYQNKTWLIDLVVYSDLIKEDVAVTTVLKNFV